MLRDEVECERLGDGVLLADVLFEHCADALVSVYASIQIFQTLLHCATVKESPQRRSIFTQSIDSFDAGQYALFGKESRDGLELGCLEVDGAHGWRWIQRGRRWHVPALVGWTRGANSSYLLLHSSQPYLLWSIGLVSSVFVWFSHVCLILFNVV